MKIKILICILVFPVLFIFVGISNVCGQFSFETKSLRISISRSGEITSLAFLPYGKEYLSPGHGSVLLKIKVAGEWEIPLSAAFHAASESENSGILSLVFPKNNVRIMIKTEIRATHVVFELIKADPAEKIEMVQWGPYLTLINRNVGEIIGVSSDNDFALGLQVLNPKTLGGNPSSFEGFDPSGGSTAKMTVWGSNLQAYSIDRSKPRTISVWGNKFPDMPVLPIPGETVIGSKIALFGCPVNKVLETLGEIEVKEKLPHPVIDGVWEKIAMKSCRSYLIADYSEESVDELLNYTARAGLMTLYHMNAWESWGHYELNPEFFPHGNAGFKTCLDKAKSMNIRLGAHTLSNFINTNDPYVTPVPDKRLAKTGRAYLMQNIDEKATSVYVASPDYFNNQKEDWLQTCVIDSELITYTSITTDFPYVLVNCTRGAFGTKPSPHATGSYVEKLLDHPYKVFFPDFEMQQEIAVNLAKRFNETGLEQLDFDGLEGCLASGQGDYAMNMFTKAFYDNLDHPVLNGTSRMVPYYWHINTYCNWGEPWSGGFTESMQEYRIKNQALFEKNHIPHMLGWYLLTDSTTLEQMEWMLARAAGYDAGFAMATSLESLQKNPRTGELLDAIREWEFCRLNKLFPANLAAALKDPKTDFHLEKSGENTWNLYPLERMADPSTLRTTFKRGMPVTLTVVNEMMK